MAEWVMDSVCRTVETATGKKVVTKEVVGTREQ